MTSKTAVTVYPAVPKADAVCVCVCVLLHFSTGIHPGKLITVEVSLQNLILPQLRQEAVLPCCPTTCKPDTNRASQSVSIFIGKTRDGVTLKSGSWKREMLMYTCAWHMHLQLGEGLPYYCNYSFLGAKVQVLRGNSRQMRKVAARFKEATSPVSCAPSQRSNPLPNPASFRSEQERPPA